MCQVVLLLGPTPRFIETQRDLKRYARLKPGQWLWEDGDEGSYKDDDCLCGIDLEATFTTAGFTVEAEAAHHDVDLVVEFPDS